MERKSVKRWGVILGISLFLYGFGNLFQPTVVVGQSMAPTLKSGRLIWIDRLYYKTHRPTRGEVVVFRRDDAIYVKRVYRGPGEVMHVVGDHGDVVGPVRASYARRLDDQYGALRSPLQVREMRVPDDCVWVLGDNFNCSEDSRHLGPIPIRDLIGRARVEVDATKASQFEFAPLPHVVHHDTSAPRLVASGESHRRHPG
jgi:signal peptidase I